MTSNNVTGPLEAKPRRRAVLAAVALVSSMGLRTRPAAAAAPVQGLADLLSPILRSVAAIQTVVPSADGNLSMSGSGFVVTSSGVIATNRHVVAGGSKITVILPGLDPLPATPLYIAEYLDFALLQVTAGEKLPTLSLGDSDSVRIGDTVMVVGNPLGVGESLSVGVISALNRDIGAGRFDHFFQTDAAINHGNSGGPMFNLKGEVIGVNTALYSSPGNTGSIGIGFALPINDVKFLLDAFLRGGKIVIGSSGVRAQRMTPEIAEAFGLKRADGSIITEVVPGGPAAGKLYPGDIVLKVGSQDDSDTNALARLIVSSAPGTVLPVTLLRDGQPLSTSITLGEEDVDPLKAMKVAGSASAEADRVMKPDDLGFTASPIGPGERKRFALNGSTAGVVVTEVMSRSAAAQKLEPGDIILSISGTRINQPSEIPERLTLLSKSKRDYAAFLVMGPRGTRWVAIPVQPQP